MSSIIQYIVILTIFLFLHYSILTVRDQTQSAPEPPKRAFGRVNMIATCVIIILTLLNIIVYILREIHEASLPEKYSLSEQCCRRFIISDIRLATNNFEASLVIGEGGFGKVYKGMIDNGTITVAIKRLNPRSKQGATEFLSEIEMLSKIRHSNIVSLIGYCDDCNEMILVYEYMMYGTLADNIHINRNKSAPLPWVQRVKICIGAARGLDYLHTGTSDRSRIIHRDVKSSNILVSENWTAKISDFGMSKIGPINQLHTHVSTKVKGTFGYMDPEYYLTYRLTRKSDVYAFGVVLFEVLCGRRAVDLHLDVEQRGLAGWAQQCIKEGKLEEIIDPSLRDQISSDSLTTFAQISDQCLHMFSTKRPTMAEVVVALELVLTLQEKGDFSMCNEELFNTGCDHGCQENTECIIKEEVAYNKRKNADSSVKEKVVINAESCVMLARIISFRKSFRQFFLGSAHRDAKRLETRKGKIQNDENNTTQSKNEENVQHVPSVEHIDADPNLKMFTHAELRAATRNFRTCMRTTPRLFTGWVDEKTYGSQVGLGMPIGVKHTYQTSFKPNELKAKMEIWVKFCHPNLVKIFGYCSRHDHFFLVQEYMERGTLSSYLFNYSQEPLTWVARLKIAIEAARGLAFLHMTKKEVIYSRFRTSNILLDRDSNAKLSDFEVLEFESEVTESCKFTPRRATRDEDNDAYASPEYKTTGELSLKTDVYGFGVILLEILSGRCAVDRDGPLKNVYLVDWARPFLVHKRRMKRIIDPHLHVDCPPNHAFYYGVLVSKCLDLTPQRRPSMEQVLKCLERINQDKTNASRRKAKIRQ